MQVPKRASEEWRIAKQAPTDFHVSKDKLERMKRELKRLVEVERPVQIQEVQRTKEMGDLSENAEYQEAKWKLRRMNSRITSLEQRIAKAIPIESGADAEGRVQIGSTVSLDNGSKILYYEIVGSQETDPTRGRISHSSPLGQALIGKQVGDMVKPTKDGIELKIVEIK